MATVGHGVYAQAVHEFFEGIRNYDVERATAALADDADFQSPWNEGTATGRDEIKKILEGLLGNAESRPSFTISDIRGSGNLATLTVSISGRFGNAAKLHTFHTLCVRDRLHQVLIRPV